MFADLSELLFANDLPHKQLIMTGLYYLPGGLVLGLGAVAVRMLLEEIFKHISLGLARSRFWTWLVVIGWLVLMKTSSFPDTLARKIHWDALIAPPESGQRQPGAAPATQQQPPLGR